MITEIGALLQVCGGYETQTIFTSIEGLMGFKYSAQSGRGPSAGYPSVTGFPY